MLYKVTIDVTARPSNESSCQLIKSLHHLIPPLISVCCSLILPSLSSPISFSVSIFIFSFLCLVLFLFAFVFFFFLFPPPHPLSRFSPPPPPPPHRSFDIFFTCR